MAAILSQPLSGVNAESCVTRVLRRQNNLQRRGGCAKVAGNEAFCQNSLLGDVGTLCVGCRVPDSELVACGLYRGAGAAELPPGAAAVCERCGRAQ